MRLALDRIVVGTRLRPVDPARVDMFCEAQEALDQPIVAAAPANSNGLVIEDLFAKAAVTTTAGMVRLFLHDGTNARLFEELAIPAATPSGTVQAVTVASTKVSRETPLRLSAGWTLKAATHNAEAINVFASGGSF